jgi:hypothetical protein
MHDGQAGTTMILYELQDTINGEGALQEEEEEDNNNNNNNNSNNNNNNLIKFLFI